MEQTVKVRRILPDGQAEVIRIRESACSGDCHKCAGCGAAQQTMLLTAKNPIGARPGDMVVLESDSGTVLKAAMLLYLVPLGLFVAGYLLGRQLWQSGALPGAAGFLLGIVPVKWYDRWLAKKKVEHTITAFAEAFPQNQTEKGDHEID